eukprot:14141164-Heterocapsa_arctica.AAC.1
MFRFSFIAPWLRIRTDCHRLRVLIWQIRNPRVERVTIAKLMRFRLLSSTMCSLSLFLSISGCQASSALPPLA